jgi:hypothetical protein
MCPRQAEALEAPPHPRDQMLFPLADSGDAAMAVRGDQGHPASPVGPTTSNAFAPRFRTRPPAAPPNSTQ